jgi:flagellar biogenesis protein FliO
MWLALAAGAEGGAAELAPPSYGWALLKLLAALIVVCALAWVVLTWVRRRWVGRAGSEKMLRLLDRLPLSARHSVWLVEAAGRYFLVGTAEAGGVTRLAELEPEAVARLAAERDRTSASAPRSFLEVLKGVRRTEKEGG